MANRYWVGGTGTWNTTSTTNWSATSGGAAGASAPTSTDLAIFDANSGTGLVTLGESVTVFSFGFVAAPTINFDFASFAVNIAGNATTVYAGNATSTLTGTPQVNLTYAGSTGTRTISAGIGVLQANSVNFTVTAGADIVSFTGSGGRIKSLTFNAGFTGAFARASSTGLFGSLTMHSGMSFTASGNTLSFHSTSAQTITSGGLLVDCGVSFDGVGGSWQLVDNLTTGSTRTVALTNGTLDLNSKTLSCGLFSSSNSNTRSIAFGTGNITLTGSGATIWTTVTSTNFTVTGTPTVNVTYAGSTGTRTINGGAVIATSEANAINFNISAGSDTVAVNNALYKNLNFTGFSGAITVSSTNIYGNLTIPATVTSFTGNLIKFAGTSGTQTVVTNNVTIASTGIQVTGGSTVVFNDALTATGTSFVFALGTIKFKAGVTTTLSAFSTSGTTQKTLQSTLTGSRATLSISSGTISVSYLTIKDIAATGGATFNAYRNLNNIDAGNNTGWDFLSTPVTTTTLAMRLGFGL